MAFSWVGLPYFGPRDRPEFRDLVPVEGSDSGAGRTVSFPTFPSLGVIKRERGSLSYGKLTRDKQEDVSRLPLTYVHKESISGKLTIGKVFEALEGKFYSRITFLPHVMYLLSVKDRTFSTRIRGPFGFDYFEVLPEYEGEVLAEFCVSDDLKVLKVVFKEFGGKELLVVFLDYDEFILGKISDPSVVVSLPPLLPPSDTSLGGSDTFPGGESSSTEESLSVVGNEVRVEKSKTEGKWALWVLVGVVLVVLFMMGR